MALFPGDLFFFYSFRISGGRARDIEASPCGNLARLYRYRARTRYIVARGCAGAKMRATSHRTHTQIHIEGEIY